MDTIGFVVSDESTRWYFREFDSICTCSLDDIRYAERNGEDTIAGRIKAVDTRELANRGEMAKVELEGSRGSLKVVLWPDEYREYSRFVVDNQFNVL